MKKILSPIIGVVLCILSVASADAQTQVRVPGFKPSASGFRFTNSFPAIPYTINVAGINMSIGDASNGMCGGMVFAARDYYEAGYLTPPPNATPPTEGPLYTYLSRRLFDSFNLPGGPLTYLHLMNPDLPDHETWFSNAGLAPRGRAWVMIMQEWPKIKADLDRGRLSPMALIHVKDRDPFKMGQNHQVLAYGYTLNGNDLVINLYDPNHPGDDNVTISLNIGNPQRTTEVRSSTGRPVFCFFQPGYTYVEPPAPYYEVVAKHSGKCLDVEGGSNATANGARIQQWDCLGGANQQWQLIANGDGSYRILARHSGKALDVIGGVGPSGNGVKVQQWDYLSGANQQWLLTPLGDGSYRILSRHSGKALDVEGGPAATANGVKVQQWDYLGGANQQWFIRDVAPF